MEKKKSQPKKKNSDKAEEAINSSQYNFEPKGKVASKVASDKQVKQTINIKSSKLETLKRASYWDRKPQSKIIEEALDLYFKDKSEYDPIPGEDD